MGILGAVSLVVGAVGLIASLYNYKSQEVQNEANRRQQSKVNAENLEFQQKQFEEQKYLNRNQYQLTASDMQKAGLNPLTMNGANLTSGNFNSTSQAALGTAPQLDLSPAISLASTVIQSRTQKDINSENIAAQKAITDAKNETDLQIAQLQANSQQEMLTSRLTQEDRQFQAKLAQDMSIANIQAELERKGLEQQKAIEAAKRVSEQLQRDDEYKKAQEMIRLEEEKIKNAKDKAEREAAIQSRNGWLNFAGKIFQSVLLSSTNFIGNKKGSPSRPIGFAMD